MQRQSASTQHSRRDKVLPTELANYRSDDPRRSSEQIIPRGWRDKIGSALKKSALIRYALRVQSGKPSPLAPWWRLSFASGHVSLQARFCHEVRIDLIWPCRWARLGWARRVPSGELRASGRPTIRPKKRPQPRGELRPPRQLGVLRRLRLRHEWQPRNPAPVCSRCTGTVQTSSNKETAPARAEAVCYRLLVMVSGSRTRVQNLSARKSFRAR